MPEHPTATARFRAELTGAWAEFLASLFFVFFGAGSVCGAVKAVRYLWSQNPCTHPHGAIGNCSVYAKKEGLPATPFMHNVTATAQVLS